MIRPQRPSITALVHRPMVHCRWINHVLPLQALGNVQHRLAGAVIVHCRIAAGRISFVYHPLVSAANGHLLLVGFWPTHFYSSRTTFQWRGIYEISVRSIYILRTNRRPTSHVENFKWPYLREVSSDSLHVWFYGGVFGVGGSNGANSGLTKFNRYV